LFERVFHNTCSIENQDA